VTEEEDDDADVADVVTPPVIIGVDATEAEAEAEAEGAAEGAAGAGVDVAGALALPG
jgi:hypothetical protein